MDQTLVGVLIALMTITVSVVLAIRFGDEAAAEHRR
jgi:hypothetical protein